MRSTAEVIADCMIATCSLVLVSYCIASLVETVSAWAHSDAAVLQELADGFVRRHNVSKDMAQKLRRFLRKNRVQEADASLEQDTRLLKALPRALQEELSYAVHMPLFSALQHFRDSNLLNYRFMRHLCVEALSDVVVNPGDDVFAEGDACARMLFVKSGNLQYFCEEWILIQTPREIARASDSLHGCDFISEGNALSEAVLWTQWAHQGRLTAVKDSCLIALSSQKFQSTVSQHEITHVYASKYAKHFVVHLNRSSYCDVTGFGLSMEDLDDDLINGDQEAHLAFISHYKVEAGTEATLMRDLLERALQADPGNSSADYPSPFFVDSEDLEDLARLQLHVEKSECLILLLTPGLLSRPWCLLEIVTAVKNAVRLVPVEIQRPGMQYKYPDEEFYEKFRKLQIIGKEDYQLLQGENCTMVELEEAVRQVFKKIALPFSPHKSNNVRQAEISDILKRATDGSKSSTCLQQSRHSRDTVVTPSTSIHPED